MYERYYGLTDKPFALTPNPRFVFYSRQYREAEGQLLYGIKSREGFLLVTGQPGTGKTTLCRDLIEKLDRDRVRSALIFNPFLNGTEMLEALLTEFGIVVPTGCTRIELLDRLNQFLLAQLALGKSCVAIFDEAQHLSSEFLEQIRVLSNLETDQEKLIQIILVGQPELLDKIRTPTMAQLDQRVSIRATLTDLDEHETDRYIHHRLNVAGARGQVRFNKRAVTEIHRASRGVPRLINLVADRTLLAGFAAQTRDIGALHVRKAVLALRGEDSKLGATASPRRIWRRRVALIGTAAAVIGTTLGIALWPGRARPANAEALYWKGTMESSPADAQQALQTLVSSYPQSPRVNDALVRLAQLQMARGARAEALHSLLTLAERTPVGPAHGKTLLWIARVQLDGGDTTSACGSLRATLADSVSADADLSRQVESVGSACVTTRVDAVSSAPDSSAGPPR
ncbi:MAG TPA: AAA family ATPase [Gemmatimonadaceae bacterium]|nr:AAA family ATPase [Gemmatimonadaceae bacterium]